MSSNNPKIQITDLVISNTINQNIPTLIFLSDISGHDLLRNIISQLLGKPYDEDCFTTDDWSNLTEIMLKLSDIPLLTKDITNVKLAIRQAEDFFNEILKENGLVIVNSTSDIYSKFLDIKNISCKMIHID